MLNTLNIKTMKNLMTVVILVLLIVSCTKNDIYPDPVGIDITGRWASSDIDLTFSSDGTFINRTIRSTGVWKWIIGSSDILTTINKVDHVYSVTEVVPNESMVLSDINGSITLYKVQ
jgi:hypothetical protein